MSRKRGFAEVGSSSSRFAPCPVCERSVPAYRINEHLDSCVQKGTTAEAPDTSGEKGEVFAVAGLCSVDCGRLRSLRTTAVDDGSSTLLDSPCLDVEPPSLLEMSTSHSVQSEAILAEELKPLCTKAVAVNEGKGVVREGQPHDRNAPVKACVPLLFQHATKTVHLIRHGHTAPISAALLQGGSEWTTAAGGDVASRTDSSGRVFDVPLSNLGLQQATGLQLKLATLKPEIIIVSPLTRALQTCKAALGTCNRSVEVSALHSEHLYCCGDVGRPPKVLAIDFPDFDLSKVPERWWYERPGAPNCALGGQLNSRESTGELRKRVGEFRKVLQRRPEKTVVVIGHSTFFRIDDLGSQKHVLLDFTLFMQEFLGSKRRMAHCEVVTLKL